MSARVGLFFLIPVALFLVAVAFMASSSSRAEPVSPLTLYAPCVPTPQLGPNVLTCKGNYHAYHMQDGKPADMGIVTPQRFMVPSG